MTDTSIYANYRPADSALKRKSHTPGIKWRYSPLLEKSNLDYAIATAPTRPSFSGVTSLRTTSGSDEINSGNVLRSVLFPEIDDHRQRAAQRHGESYVSIRKKLLTEQYTSKRGLKDLQREVVESFTETQFNLGLGIELSTKEFTFDILANKILLISGTSDYCALCREPGRICNSHVIPNATLKNMEKESGGKVIYSYKHGIVKAANNVTWKILCRSCENMKKRLNTSESRLEYLRLILQLNQDRDVEVKATDAEYVLFAAAFILYRGFMVNVDLYTIINTAPLQVTSQFLQCFYSLKQYCQNPDTPRRPDIYFLLLPSNDIFHEFDQLEIRSSQVSVLLNSYMRRIELTHVATVQLDSRECKFLYTCFDRFHFVLPITEQETLKKHLLARYPKSMHPQHGQYDPNLSRHQSPDQPHLMLRNRESMDSFFPTFLYEMANEGVKQWTTMFEQDLFLRCYARVKMGPVRGVIFECPKNSRILGENTKKPSARPISEQGEKKFIIFKKDTGLAIPQFARNGLCYILTIHVILLLFVHVL